MFAKNAALWAKRQRFYAWLFIAGAILLVGAGLLWWFKVRVQPERVFWGMLERSLATSGVTMEAAQDSNGTKVQYTLQYSLGGEPKARSLTTVEQAGSTVVTELLGTPDASYTRYLDIRTDQKSKDGKPLDMSSVEGVWAKTENSSGLFSQGLLGLNVPLGGLPVPIANLAPQDRQALLDQMRTEGVYETDFKNVRSQRVNGRLQYVYKTKIQVILYANLMKQFGKSVGLHDLDQLDPNSYSGSPPIEAELTVDVRSRRLAAVTVTTPQGDYSQTFAGYDVPVSAEIPEQTITGQELQKRLQEQL